MLIYFLVLFYWLALYFLGKNAKKSRSNLFFAILPLYLIMALKSVSVGSDTISYYHRYIDASNILTAIQMIFHDILGAPFFVYYAVVAAIICYILALFLKYYSDNIYLSLITYMTIGLFTMSMSGIRQMLAISFCTIPLIVAKARGEAVFSSKKSKRRFFFLGLFCVLLAFSFHNSALVFFPILFMFNIRLTKRQTIIIVIVATVVSLLLRPVIVALMTMFAFGNRYQQYDFNEGYAMNILILLIPIIIGLFCVLISRPENNDKYYSRYLSLMFIFLALQIAFNNLALSHAQISRLGYYFLNSYVILIPYAIKKVALWIRPTVVVAMLSLFLVYFYLGTNGGTLKIDDYKFFWQEPEYYQNTV